MRLNILVGFASGEVLIADAATGTMLQAKRRGLCREVVQSRYAGSRKFEWSCPRYRCGFYT
jgi:hypothetical protein